MLIAKYHKNLTINSGVTVTATNVSNLTYKKGMYLCVMGELVNNGTISMTARGTYNQAGENVYLWKNIDNTFEYVPAVGGAAVACNTAAKAGTGRQTGGGAGGQVETVWGGRGGSSSAGTSYSGGSGGGGTTRAVAGNAGANRRCSEETDGYFEVYVGGGGAGNPGGAGTASGYNGQTGTGGLLVVYANTFVNKNTINANGMKGGDGYCPGGSSGGGSINIFYSKLKSTGTIVANGGIAAKNVPASGYQGVKGIAGGNGTVTLNKVSPDLNYIEKNLELDVGEEYQIDKNNITFVNQNGKQSNLVAVGELKFEILDKTIADIDENGKITARNLGQTKVKITDITNNIYTYIYIEVINGTKIDVKEGKNFTIALKQNGTVWSYGSNINGELGAGDNEDKNKPTKIENLTNIKKISVGYSHSLALSKTGEVYAWGFGEKGQLGDGNASNSNDPVKVDGLSNIKEIACYKNMSMAISNDGTIYAWGEGFSSLPMKIIFAEKAAHISGKLILTQNGKVYDVTKINTPIEGLTNIARISCGEAHILALNPDGTVYSHGTNTYGECGTATTGAINAKEVECDIYNISAGNQISILKDNNGKVYVLGNNSSRSNRSSEQLQRLLLNHK